jgi:hemoglobin-like flavoprotein
MAQLATSSNPNMREYFEQTQLSKLLERLVVDLGEERPADVLLFIEEWAAKERKAKLSSGDATRRRGSRSVAPEDQARMVWRQAGPNVGEKIVERFFDVLFTQHASLKRKLFNNVDITVAKAGFAPLLNQAVFDELPPATIQALGQQHGVGRSVEQKHFHYFLTAMLTATNIVFGNEQFQPAAEGFRLIFTKVGDNLMIGLNLRASNDTTAAETTSLQSEWQAVTDKNAVLSDFFNTLFLQHPSLRTRLFKDVDINVLSASIIEAITALLDNRIDEDALVNLGKVHGVGRGAQNRHFVYILLAALSALSRHTPNFAAMREAWRLKLTHACDLLRKGANNCDEGSNENFTQGPGCVTALPEATSKELYSSFSDKSPFDVVHDSWAAIPDKNQLVTRFFTVLLTQHSSLLKSVLKDVDLEGLIPTVVTYLTAFVDGEKPTSDLKTLAQVHGRPRNLQMKHLHYFLSAALTALSITIGSNYPAVSEHWHQVLSMFIDEIAIGAGCNTEESFVATDSLSVLPATSPLTKKPDGGADADDKDKNLTDADCITSVRGSWEAIGTLNKRKDVVDTFFHILFTQHPSVKRGLFKDVDLTAVNPLFEAALTEAITTPSYPALPAVSELARTLSAERKVETKHYHYFLSAMLASLAVSIGRDEYPNVAEPWRRVLTTIMQACMLGAPPLDTGLNTSVYSAI